MESWTPDEPVDADDVYYAAKRIPGKVYFSGPFPFRSNHVPGFESHIGELARFSYSVTDPEYDVTITRDNGLDVLIRETAKHRHQLRAIFLEDEREVAQIWLQRFNMGGNPSKACQIILTGHEVGALKSFLDAIEQVGLPDDRGIRIEPGIIREVLADPATRQAVYESDREDVYRMIENDQAARDVRAMARRRQQLELFDAMLNDPSLVEQRQDEFSLKGPEDVWQKFFEDNRWIFGLGLAEQVLLSWLPEKLEAVVRGASIAGPGKRADAVLRSVGVFSSLCFVEIKTPSTELLRARAYRSGSWAISDEVAGAIAQCHRTLEAAQTEFAGRINVQDSEGAETGEIVHQCRPRSYLIVGSLNQFVSSSGGFHHDRYRCFEQMRRALNDPTIITYDELYQRAVHLLNADL